ncbi:MAG: 2-hydroxyacyl-CoA dehydratase [Phascolarctobacterium sp.]|nr:2-hydroxyacyl-CoA dehydratase [Phascolarctobacterium sp.]
MRCKGKEIIATARAQGKPIIVLAGRPYHIDPKVNHSIDRLLTTMGAALVSEDAVSDCVEPKVLSKELQVLNQWTYHSRLYAAAKYVAENEDMHMVQLVSFGCGCDAITADECRRLLEANGKIYTQIKIDDIDNLGTAKIRLRSLFAAVGLES